MHSVRGRRPVYSTVQLLGTFLAGVAVAAMVLRLVRPNEEAAADSDELTTAQWLRSQLAISPPTQPASSRRRCGALPMDPPVVPRILNAIKFEISEEDFDSTLALVADTPHARIVEVGAHNGGLATLLAKLPNVQSVLSFEPTPGRAEEIRAALGEQLRDFPGAVDKITVRGDAVSNYTGTARFYTSEQVKGAVNSLVDTSEVFGDMPSQIVNVVKLDDVVDYRVNFLIVDTQGFDDKVLLGAQRLMENYGVDIVLFEYAPALMRRAGGDPAGIMKFMHSMGYFCLDTLTLPVGLPLQYSADVQWRSLERFPTLFQAWKLFGGEHGTWSNILCFSS